MKSKSVEEVVAALEKSKNVLLYGPPGTGKTWLLSSIINYIKNREFPDGDPALLLGEEDPFGSIAGINGLPQELKIEWLTFHQSYSYEEFIIGKKPKPKEGGIILEPHFGTLMSLAVNLDIGTNSKGCLLIIDEINRANASQVFGEFITLLDPSYRRTIQDSINDKALTVRLPGITYSLDGQSEEIKMLHGEGMYKLPEDWKFPEHVYVLATMNSVDKAALPLDSALTRRFHRIEIRPDIELLALHLSVDMVNLENKASEIHTNVRTCIELTAEETTILLLDRINVLIALDMGSDFELGHALVWSVTEATVESRWLALINAWDTMLYPQLAERFAGRNETLWDVLKVYPGSPTEVAFFERKQIGGNIPTENSSLNVCALQDIKESYAINVLRNLAI